jgi:hypothetical protein
MASHNTYFQLLSETGLIGLTCFAAILIRLLRKTYRYDRACFCMMLGLLVQIALLDALDNRCVWSELCWLVMCG